MGTFAEAAEEKAGQQTDHAEHSQQSKGRGAGGAVRKKQGQKGYDAHDQHDIGGRAGDGKTHGVPPRVRRIDTSS